MQIKENGRRIGKVGKRKRTGGWQKGKAKTAQGKASDHRGRIIGSNRREDAALTREDKTAKGVASVGGISKKDRDSSGSVEIRAISSIAREETISNNLKSSCRQDE